METALSVCQISGKAKKVNGAVLHTRVMMPRTRFPFNYPFKSSAIFPNYLQQFFQILHKLSANRDNAR